MLHSSHISSGLCAEAVAFSFDVQSVGPTDHKLLQDPV